MDSSCSLCDHHLETSIHLFWECPLARVVWFGSEWSIRSEGILLQNPMSLIEILVDLSATLGFNGVVKENFLLMGALILDQLWKLRNAKVHDGRSVKMNHISRELSVRGREHWDIRRIPQSSSIPHPSTGWCFPNHGVIKFNCDAAVGGSFSCIVVVARNWRGEVVLALSRRVNTTIPLQAEAEALLWATHLAAELFMDLVIFESDSKSCIVALSNRLAGVSWRIRSCLSDIFLYLADHPSWSFKWIRREANGASHALARWSLQNRYWGSFNSVSGPLCIVNACLLDQSQAVSGAVSF